MATASLVRPWSPPRHSNLLALIGSLHGEFGARDERRNAMIMAAVLLALERRPSDGAEKFFAAAERAGFEVVVLQIIGRVLIVEMCRRGAAPAGIEGSASAVAVGK